MKSCLGNPSAAVALRKAKEWVLEHLERSEGLGAIYPAMVNSVFALRALGYTTEDPVTAREIGHLAQFEIEDDDTLRMQPCVSPVWDTALTMFSLQEAGLPPDHPALVKAASWLLDHQVLGGGDWQVTNPDVDPGGWAFEFRNDFYPDVDDTAFVLMALQRVTYPDPARLEQALRRGTAWMLSMQNRDGGWGAFDRDNDSAFLTRVPFADHNAMIDPSTGDVTARALEYLGRSKWPASDPRIQRAVNFLLKDQTPEGPWYGRWGVNYLYGTSGALRALETVGLQESVECERAVSWLRAVQNPDGGFGETCGSYDDPKLKARGHSTASQTAWALIGLLAAGDISEPSVKQALDYLLDSSGRTGLGRKRLSPGPGSRGFSISNMTSTGMYSRFTPWRGTGTCSPEDSNSSLCVSHQKSFPRTMETATMEMGGIDEVSAKHDDQVEQVHRRQADAGCGEVSPGHDAGAPACVQSDVHGLRAHS